MDFGTFLLYFIGAIVVLVVGFYVIVYALAYGSAGVMAVTDGTKDAKNRRAAAKWERIEDNLEDDEEAPHT